MCIGQQAGIDLGQLINFHRDCSDKEFLFGKEIQEYLRDLYSKGVDLHCMKDRLQKLPQGDDRIKLCEENSKLLLWFGDQYEVSKKLFSKYLCIDKK
jgi:hypothetical protein